MLVNGVQGRESNATTSGMDRRAVAPGAVGIERLARLVAGVPVAAATLRRTDRLVLSDLCESHGRRGGHGDTDTDDPVHKASDTQKCQ